VDEKRVTGPHRLGCTLAFRHAASIFGYLGLQDACQKRVPASQRAGAWAGSVCHTDDQQVTIMVKPDKWSKARAYVSQLLKIASTTNLFDSKQLESIRGFLIFVVRTCPAFSSYLKGLHLTIDSWRPGRQSDGWKDMGSYELERSLADQHPPQELRGVPRLLSDLQALSMLFQPSIPP